MLPKHPRLGLGLWLGILTLVFVNARSQELFVQVVIRGLVGAVDTPGRRREAQADVRILPVGLDVAHLAEVDRSAGDKVVARALKLLNRMV